MSASAIVEALVERYGSLNAASRETKIPGTTLHNIRRGKRVDLRYSTICSLAAASGKQPHEIVQMMGSEDGSTRDTTAQSRTRSAA